MRRNGGESSLHHIHPSRRRWRIPFFASLLVSVVFIFFTIDLANPDFDLEMNLGIGREAVEAPPPPPPPPPRIAYLITGTKGDSQRMRRTLQAIYHPRNHYILHLDLEAPPRERIDLAIYVKAADALLENVHVIETGNLVTYKGPTMIACTLHAISILLKQFSNWDWFINLSASDYPLMTQDDILHVFSSLPRNLNFIENNQSTGWKVNQRARPIVVDPGLYLSKKFDLFVTSEHRDLPSSFNLFTGSAWVMLTRTFLEYCIWGWDNLPRTILMYYVNFISSPEGYFHTVICNSNDEFRESAVSHDLHYIAWDTPPKQHPRSLSIRDFSKMVKSGAPFARKFKKGDPVMDKIDRELLGRPDGQFTPGAWCIGPSDAAATGGTGNRCSVRGNDSLFHPGPGAQRLQGLLDVILSPESRNSSCLVKS